MLPEDSSDSYRVVRINSKSMSPTARQLQGVCRQLCEWGAVPYKEHHGGYRNRPLSCLSPQMDCPCRSARELAVRALSGETGLPGASDADLILSLSRRLPICKMSSSSAYR